jgi:DNA polymerase-3 subunit alpha
MVTSVRRITTKTNRTMAIVTLEDLDGTIELVVFPDCYDRHPGLFEPDVILEIVGRVERRGDDLQIVCDSASTELTKIQAPHKPVRTVRIQLPISTDAMSDVETMQELDAILQRHEGDDLVELHLPRGGQVRVLRSRSRRVEWNDILEQELRQLLGLGSVTLEGPRLAS